MVTDYFGRTLKVGDAIVYGQRQGNSGGTEFAVVFKIEDSKVGTLKINFQKEGEDIKVYVGGRGYVNKTSELVYYPDDLLPVKIFQKINELRINDFKIR